MPATLTPSMLTLVREAKGWSQRDLARAANVSQAFVSQAETGRIDVAEDRLRILAHTLDCPVALLTAPEVRSATAMSCLHHRRRTSKLSAAASRRIEGLAYLTRITVESVLDGLDARVDTSLEPGMAVGATTSAESDSLFTDDLRTDPAEAARQVRLVWGITGPIRDLIGLLESHGFLVVVRPFGSRSQDAVSSWPADGDHPPVIIVNTGLATDRQRFTLAHELGHLLLHPLPVDGQEEEANTFAAEFLAPADEIGPALEGLTTSDFRRLLDLKSKWRVSIGALVRRALDVGAVSPRQFREFRLRLTRLGWDANEPGDLEPERPRLLESAFNLGRSRGMSEQELARLALMTPDAFRRHYPAPEHASRPKQSLNNPSTRSRDIP